MMVLAFFSFFTVGFLAGFWTLIVLIGRDQKAP